MIWLIVQFVLGVILLNKSADWFARGSALTAELTGMPRVWMGAVLGGFVSAIPEKLFSCFGAAFGHSELAVGNSIGSVTFNSVLLGICLLQARGPVDKRWFRDHGIPMLIMLLILTAFGMSSSIGWPVGLLFIFLCVLYVVWSVVAAERQPDLARQAEEVAAEALGEGAGQHRWWVAVLLR
jgi:cation:H+ antiporter